MLDLLLIISLGFLGSFGHCMGMCGPLTVAFALSSSSLAHFNFHILLNLGRIISYALVGAILGGLGSILIASGQLAGIGSGVRQGIAITTGIMLIWFGLRQIKPDFLPKLPLIHPLQGKLHESLSRTMTKLSSQMHWWIPLILGGFWGVIPCGFLYVAQIKAAQTGDFFSGAITMAAFGLGTTPMMLGVGIWASRLSTSKRSQLFRLGGWITLAIGTLTLLRTGVMVDYTGHGAIILLILALTARPLSNLWKAPLHYRRAIGVGAFILAIAHTLHMVEHSLNWELTAIPFMLTQHRWGLITGCIALLLMTPAALTSFDYLQQVLGKYWRLIHLLTVPALILATFHTIFIGSHYLGELGWSWQNQIRTISLAILTLAVLLIRSPFCWSLFSLQKLYASPLGKRKGSRGAGEKNN